MKTINLEFTCPISGCEIDLEEVNNYFKDVRYCTGYCPEQDCYEMSSGPSVRVDEETHKKLQLLSDEELSGQKGADLFEPEDGVYCKQDVQAYLDDLELQKEQKKAELDAWLEREIPIDENGEPYPKREWDSYTRVIYKLWESL